ncbi:hypothetical protein MUU53_12175 [Rhizobium lemnae]|uniref:ABC transporter permease n=1 Tax=Rhizobium lemnae TaxID=1214924 RepID=A0ABV8EEH5_9HYPH|nr:hypothetical protein [Rhizobium lemnae]MCJ8508669.1 hypothetical protein [Rhizobium lemnae]
MITRVIFIVIMAVGLGAPLSLVMLEVTADPIAAWQAIERSTPSFIRTVLLSSLVPLLSLFPSVALASSLRRCHPLVRLIGIVLCSIPLFLNLLVVIIAWMLILEPRGLVAVMWSTLGLCGSPPQLLFTPIATVLAMVYVVTPVMALMILQAMMRTDAFMLEAAKLLAVPPVVRFVLVELGSVAPTIIASILAGYLISLNLYLIPEYLTGPELTTLGFLIQQNVLQSFNITRASAQSLMLVAAAVAPVLIALWVERALRR